MMMKKMKIGVRITNKTQNTLQENIQELLLV